MVLSSLRWALLCVFEGCSHNSYEVSIFPFLKILIKFMTLSTDMLFGKGTK